MLMLMMMVVVVMRWRRGNGPSTRLVWCSLFGGWACSWQSRVSPSSSIVISCHLWCQWSFLPLSSSSSKKNLSSTWWNVATVMTGTVGSIATILAVIKSRDILEASMLRRSLNLHVLMFFLRCSWKTWHQWWCFTSPCQLQTAPTYWCQNSLDVDE